MTNLHKTVTHNQKCTCTTKHENKRITNIDGFLKYGLPGDAFKGLAGMTQTENMVKGID